MYIVLRLSALLLAVFLAACSGGETPTESAPLVTVKLLVTVEMPPTLTGAERMATLQAMPATPTAPPPTPTPTETPYVGVFIGEAQQLDQASLPSMNVEITAAPTTDTDGCSVAADPAFGELWKRDASLVRRMGCAIQERFGFAGGVQVFERGVMYRRDSTNEVWAISPGRVTAGQYWYTNQAAGAIQGGLPAPEGVRVPAGVFGSVWAGDTAISQALGFAITPDQVADMNIQRFDGGTLFLDVTVGQVFVLLVDGDAYGPF